MNIWERLIMELGVGDGWAGAGEGRFSSFPEKEGNFQSREEEENWPYNSDKLMQYGVPEGPKGKDRGTPMGVNVSGQYTPSSTYLRTWQNEAAGQPSRIAPFQSFDGPSIHATPAAGPVLDVDGEPVSDEDVQPVIVDPKVGPNNMWGGAGTIPGQDRGFAASPKMGDESDDTTIWQPPEERKMESIREFFDPSPVNAEEVENPNQAYEKDQTDDELENKMNRVYGQEDNHEFDDGKESSDDSAEFDHKTSDSEGGMKSSGGEEPAGVVMLDDEPAGIISIGGEADEMPGMSTGQPEDDSDLPGPPPMGGQDSADFQLTIEPEAGALPSLSQFMEPQDSLVGGAPGTLGMPAPGTARGLMGMNPSAKGLVPPQQSAWDNIAIQVGDAVINLTKSGQPPVMESAWSRFVESGPPAYFMRKELGHDDESLRQRGYSEEDIASSAGRESGLSAWNTRQKEAQTGGYASNPGASFDEGDWKHSRNHGIDSWTGPDGSVIWHDMDRDVKMDASTGWKAKWVYYRQDGSTGEKTKHESLESAMGMQG